MEFKHKVGHMTQFGKLVAESIIWDNPNQTVAVYEMSHKDAYQVIIWDISDKIGEFEISRTIHDEDEKAIEMFLSRAFQVSL